MKLWINIKTLKDILIKTLCILNRKQKIQCVGLLLGMFVSSLFETLGVSAVIPFVLVLFSPDEMMENQYVKWVSDVFGIETGVQLVVLVAILVVFVYLIKNVVVLVYQYLQGRFRNSVEKELRVRVFTSYMNSPYTFFLNTNSSELLRGTSENIVSVVNTIDAFCCLINEIITLLMIGVFLVWLDPFIAVTLLLIALLISLTIIMGFKNRTARIGKKCTEYFAKTKQILLESFGGYKEILVNKKENYFISKYHGVNNEVCKLNTKNLFILKVPGRIIEVVFITGLLSLSCIRIVSGGNTAEFVAVLSALALAAVRILPAMTNLTNYTSILIYNRVATEMVYDEIVMNENREIATANCVNENDGNLPVRNNYSDQEYIKVEDISFGYTEGLAPVLDGVTFSIEKGESIGIVGESGAGKSTLLDIMLGLLVPQKGNVFFGGKDIKDPSVRWADIIGFVPQSVYLLDASIRENIAFAIPENEIEDDRVWEKLKDAQLLDFVKALPEGLDTKLGERGVRMSGGQRQRLAIARALYHDPEVLFLDEATSALDSETEEAVMSAIESLQGKITMIIVAHRLTTISKCNKVIRVQNGSIHEVKNVLQEA